MVRPCGLPHCSRFAEIARPTCDTEDTETKMTECLFLADQHPVIKIEGKGMITDTTRKCNAPAFTEQRADNATPITEIPPVDRGLETHRPLALPADDRQ